MRTPDVDQLHGSGPGLILCYYDNFSVYSGADVFCDHLAATTAACLLREWLRVGLGWGTQVVGSVSFWEEPEYLDLWLVTGYIV